MAFKVKSKMTNAQALAKARKQKVINSYLKNLDGQEISSLHYEDVVAVEGNKVISYGKVVDKIDTVPKAKRLFDEAFENEFGYSPHSKKFQEELEKEFGTKAVDETYRYGAKPTIQTADGEKKYFKTEFEDDNGKWKDNYSIKDGFWVIHDGKRHHIYK